MTRVFNIRIFGVFTGFIVTVMPGFAQSGIPRQENKAAVVNGGDIGRREFDNTLLKIQKRVLKFGRPLTSGQVVTLSKEVMESLIRREILFQESRKQGIRYDKKAVDQKIDSLISRFSSKPDFEKELALSHVTERTLRSRLEKNSAVQQYITQEFQPKVEVKGRDMIAFYDSRLDLFKQPLQVRGSHILIHLDPKWDESRKKKTRKRAEKILKDLKNGLDFGEVARERSDGPARTNGGDLGYVRMGQLDKPLEDVFFGLKPGEISDIVETGYGYHIFQVKERKPETILPYESVKDKIRGIILKQLAQEKADLYAKSIRKKAEVEIFVKNY